MRSTMVLPDFPDYEHRRSGPRSRRLARTDGSASGPHAGNRALGEVTLASVPKPVAEPGARALAAPGPSSVDLSVTGKRYIERLEAARVPNPELTPPRNR